MPRTVLLYRLIMPPVKDFRAGDDFVEAPIGTHWGFGPLILDLAHTPDARRTGGFSNRAGNSRLRGIADTFA